jgi:hypothetical protein
MQAHMEGVEAEGGAKKPAATKNVEKRHVAGDIDAKKPVSAENAAKQDANNY